MICLLLEPYDAKQSQLYSKAEYAHQTAKKIILVQPIQKVVAQFKTDSISKNKCEELVALIEKSKITASKVACVSKSMSLLTEWMLGIVDYRRSQLELEPIIEYNTMRQAVVDRLPRELQKRRDEFLMI